MAYIQQRGERKYKITVCNGYTTTGKKRMQARTIDVPKEIPKRGIKQYVYAEAERLEKRFRTGIDESENTKFETYAEHWLDRAAKRYKASTLAGYRKMLEVAYPYIGGLPLCKIRPMVLEEFAEELRKRPGRGGKPLSENTVHKYLDAVSAVLQRKMTSCSIIPPTGWKKSGWKRCSSVFPNNGRCKSSCSVFCRSRCFIGCTT